MEILYLILLVTSITCKIVFVQEICRHGARTPIITSPDFKYVGKPGILTSLGATQMYEIGKELRKRYIDEELLSPVYNKSEVHVVSTNFQRTVASAQNQMFGMYAASNSVLDKRLEKLHARNIRILHELRDLESCKNDEEWECDTHLIWDGDHLPVYYADIEQEFWNEFGEIVDEDKNTITKLTIESIQTSEWMGAGKCPAMMIQHDYQRSVDSLWKDIRNRFELSILKDVVAIFNMTADDTTYYHFYELCDLLWSEQFHGFETRLKFTPLEWETVKEVQLYTLMHLVESDIRRIQFTRLAKPVLNMMRRKIGIAYDSKFIKDLQSVKFLEYSTHDWHLTIFLHFLNVTNADIRWINYGSNFLLELHQVESEECIIADGRPECFLVKIFFNFKQLQLSACENLDCTFLEFQAHLDSVFIEDEFISEHCDKTDFMEIMNEDEKES